MNEFQLFEVRDNEYSTFIQNFNEYELMNSQMFGLFQSYDFKNAIQWLTKKVSNQIENELMALKDETVIIEEVYPWKLLDSFLKICMKGKNDTVIPILQDLFQRLDEMIRKVKSDSAISQNELELLEVVDEQGPIEVDEPRTFYWNQMEFVGTEMEHYFHYDDICLQDRLLICNQILRSARFEVRQMYFEFLEFNQVKIIMRNSLVNLGSNDEGNKNIQDIEKMIIENYTFAQVKGQERSIQKIQNKHKDSHHFSLHNNELKDLLRCSILTESAEETIELVDWIKSYSEQKDFLKIQQIKNLFKSDSDLGSYKDIKIILIYKYRNFCEQIEVQIIQKKVLKYKKVEHKVQDQTRVFKTDQDKIINQQRNKAKVYGQIEKQKLGRDHFDSLLKQNLDKFPSIRKFMIRSKPEFFFKQLKPKDFLAQAPNFETEKQKRFLMELRVIREIIDIDIERRTDGTFELIPCLNIDRLYQDQDRLKRIFISRNAWNFDNDKPELELMEELLQDKFKDISVSKRIQKMTFNSMIMKCFRKHQTIGKTLFIFDINKNIIIFTKEFDEEILICACDQIDNKGQIVLISENYQQLLQDIELNQFEQNSRRNTNKNISLTELINSKNYFIKLIKNKHEFKYKNSNYKLSFDLKEKIMVFASEFLGLTFIDVINNETVQNLTLGDNNPVPIDIITLKSKELIYISCLDKTLREIQRNSDGIYEIKRVFTFDNYIIQSMVYNIDQSKLQLGTNVISELDIATGSLKTINRFEKVRSQSRNEMQNFVHLILGIQEEHILAFSDSNETLKVQEILTGKCINTIELKKRT